MYAHYLYLSKYPKPFKQRVFLYIYIWKNKLRNKGKIREGRYMNPLGI